VDLDCQGRDVLGGAGPSYSGAAVVARWRQDALAREAIKPTGALRRSSRRRDARGIDPKTNSLVQGEEARVDKLSST
jgi:hypothetical protein